MWQEIRERFHRRYQEVTERDTKWIMGLSIGRLDGITFPLIAVFVLLNLADVVSTLIALARTPAFLELNPIASGLFQQHFAGFMVALVLKYLPLVPILYVASMHDSDTKPAQVRSLKLGVLAVLAAANIYYVAIVINNFSNLFAASIL